MTITEAQKIVREYLKAKGVPANQRRAWTYADGNNWYEVQVANTTPYGLYEMVYADNATNAKQVAALKWAKQINLGNIN